MIASFGNDATRHIFDGVNSKEARKIPIQLWPVMVRTLDMISAAHKLGDLSAPPGNRLELLKGELKGLHSIRVNDQYRIIFRWTDSNAYEVRITDYH